MTAVFDGVANGIDALAGGDAGESVRGGWRQTLSTIRKQGYASCWQMAPNESSWMWTVYCDDKFGIALRSTYERLDRELEIRLESGHDLMIGCVTYGDYRSFDYTIRTDRFALVMSKNRSYADEREVRVICDRRRAADDELPGFYARVNLNQLLTSVVVSPNAPNWFRETVEGTCSAFDCLVSVLDSSLMVTPKPPW